MEDIPKVEELTAEPQTEAVTQEGMIPVSVNVEVHQDANPESEPAITKEEIRQEVVEEEQEKREDNEQWQQISNLQMELSELKLLLEGLLNPKEATSEATQEAGETPELLNPVSVEEEPVPKLKKKRHWVF
jgi:hypothetical protein